jgi:NAD-dependent deacetylase
MLLETAKRVVALTGAGVSTPSGIPDFRSAETGLWSHANPMEIASIWGFREKPDRFYEWMRPLAQSIVAARPNPAHAALVQLELMEKLVAVITQNIDALHHRIGSRNVIELHGHLRTVSCLSCRYQGKAELHLPGFLHTGTLPVCPVCGAILKPDVVLFGEPLPELEVLRAQEETLHCDLMLVAGSSLEVMPAADLPALAARRGAKLIMVNFGKTPYDHLADVVLHGDVADVLPRLVAVLRRPLPPTL